MKNILFNCYSASDLNDNIFKKDRIWLSSGKNTLQKDDKNQGFLHFARILNENNYNIHTQDLWNKKDKIDLQINFAYHQKIICDKSYLLLPESVEIYDQNNLNILKKNYTKIFCQYDDFIDNTTIFKTNYPFIIKKKFDQDINSRTLLSAMICSNKSQKKKSKKDLYFKRFEIIDFMEKYENSFKLYGMDWNLPFKRSGNIGRTINFLNKTFRIKSKLKNYKGVIKDKSDILKKTKFSFCIENNSINGYISDPIFDSFSNGCIPIYLGAPNVNKYIPENTFIDLRRFDNIDSLFTHINSMSEKKIEEFQLNINKFINSDKIKYFNEEKFANIIINHLKEDLR